MTPICTDLARCRRARLGEDCDYAFNTTSWFAGAECEDGLRCVEGTCQGEDLPDASLPDASVPDQEVPDSTAPAPDTAVDLPDAGATDATSEDCSPNFGWPLELLSEGERVMQR